MARWTTLTIVPVADADPEEVLDRALADAGAPVGSGIRRRAATGEPYLCFKHRGRRERRSADIAENVVDGVQIAAVAEVDNTTDSVSMSVYEPEGDSLRRQETREGTLAFRRHVPDDPDTHYQTVEFGGDADTLLDYFDDEYGIRPVFNFFSSDEYDWEE